MCHVEMGLSIQSHAGGRIQRIVGTIRFVFAYDYWAALCQYVDCLPPKLTPLSDIAWFQRPDSLSLLPCMIAGECLQPLGIASKGIAHATSHSYTWHTPCFLEGLLQGPYRLYQCFGGISGFDYANQDSDGQPDSMVFNMNSDDREAILNCVQMQMAIKKDVR